MSNTASKDPAKIVVVIPRFLPIVGGSETQALNLCSQWYAMGNEVSVLTLEVNGESKKSIINSVKVFRLRRFSNDAITGAFSFIPAIFTRRNTANIVIIFAAGWLGAMAAVGCLILSIPYIVRIATAGDFAGLIPPEINYPRWKRITKRLLPLDLMRRFFLSCAHSLIAISAEINKEFVSNGVSPKKIVALRNGVDVNKFRPITSEEKRRLRQKLGLDHEKKYMLFAGRLVRRKGLDILLKAFSQIKDEFSDLHLIIAGESKGQLDGIESSIRDMCLELELNNRINFVGLIQEPEKYYQASDIFVFPSRKEGMPNAILEAMSCGMPVLASDIGGNVDIITHMVNGFLFANEDVEMLANSIRALMQNDNLQAQLGNKARDYILQFHDIKNIAQRYLDLMKEMIR